MSLTRAVLLVSVLGLVCVGCGDDDGGGGAGGGLTDQDGGEADGSTSLDASADAAAIPGLTALRIEPATLTIIDDGVGAGETGQYLAIGTFDTGERDVTTLVTWSLDDALLGSINNGFFTSRGFGGQTLVHARAIGAEAQADLIVRLVVSNVATDAPAGIADLFPDDTSNDTVVDDDTLRIIYPSHETMFPRNLERVDHQWRAANTLDRFEIRFTSAVADVRYYTADKHWLPDLAAWQWLANTHAGRSLQMSVRGVSSASPSTVTRSQEITLLYSRSEVPGALYYWSTGAQGVLKATISSPQAVKFFTDPATDDATCVSCHTVSRNGRKLSAGYGGERLRAINISDRSLLIPSDPMMQGAEYGWGTFNPDASRLLYASKGVLRLLNADNGNVLLDPVPLPTGGKASHPDWAPSNGFVAISYSTGASKFDNKNVQGTSIARIAVNSGDTFGTPEILLASTDTLNDTLFFPSYAPNSQWIAFVHGTGKSKDNVTGVIQLIPGDGGPAINLTRMNERVRHEDGITGIGNSMPTWAPSTKPDIFWIAFSSVRAYGDVLPAGRDQLWAVAIDPAKIGTREDASYAAFWLPFQDMGEGNHRAFWAIDTEVECPSTIEVCDNLDNDCDGVVDEDCCTPSAEVCDGMDNSCDGVIDEGCCVPSPEVCDGVDNDCDLAKDEGCGCGLVEICDNGIDDDCDGVVDCLE